MGGDRVASPWGRVGRAGVGVGQGRKGRGRAGIVCGRVRVGQA